MGRIVVRGFFDREAIGRLVGQADPLVICLHLFVAAACRLELLVADAPEQTAFWIGGIFVRIGAIGKLVMVHELDAVIGLIELAVGFAADRIGYAGLCHQIAFVAAVDEYFALNSKRWGCFGFEGDGLDGVVLFGRFYDPVTVEYFYVCLLYVLFENVFGDMGLKDPLFELAVVLADPSVEIEGEPFDRIFVTDIRIAETSGSEPAQMLTGFDEEDTFMHACSRISSNDAT